MQPLISEFSYGYALTQELATGIIGGITGAPIFPSLRSEGQPDGGYDLQIPRIGVPLYFQFKLSDYLSRASASEWSAFNDPYYRMHLYPLRNSDQHNLLLDLERAGNEVHYAAPEFHTAPELNAAYFARQVYTRSRLFRPLAIGPLPDNDAHSVCFRSGVPGGYLFSKEGRPIQSQSGEDLAKHFLTIFPVKRTLLDVKYFDAACNNLLSIIEKRKDFREAAKQLAEMKSTYSKTREDLARYLAHLSWVFFDAFLVVLGSRQS